MRRLALACLLWSSACLAQTPPPRHHSLSVLESVPTKQKVVALTIDLGESATRASVEKLLTWLDQHHVRATFFVTGWFVRTFPDLTKRLVADGHDLGNHTDKHPHCTRVSSDRVKQELRAVEELLRRQGLALDEPRYFRPPYGEYNSSVVKAAGEIGYRTVMWSATTVDYNTRGDASHCAQVLLRYVHPGRIILTHATAVSAAMVPQVVATLKGGGMRW